MAKTFFTNATLIDGNGGNPIVNGGMMIDNDKISAIGRVDDFGAIGDEINIVDCSGKTIMPGMINSHVHIFMEPYTWDRHGCMNMPNSNLCVNIIDNLHKTLRSGITYVRDLGGYNHLDIEFRDLVDEGKVVGPNIICAGRPLTITGGHCTDFGRICDGPAEFVKGVREQIRDGADFIKIMPTGGYGRPKMKVNHMIMADSNYMTQEEIKAVVDEAHKMGKTVAAHCNGYIGVYNAVHNGVDTIEHGQFRDTTGSEISQLIEEMVKRGTWLIPTLSAFFKEYEREEVERNYLSVVESFRMCCAAGVKIAMGTDSGVPWVGHDKGACEVEHMSLYGMTNMQAIVASTREPAKMMGIIDDYGTLECGKRADFLILDENPLDNLKALQNKLVVVYKGGRPV